MFLCGYLHYEIYNEKSISHQPSESDPAPTKVRAKTSTDFSGNWIRPMKFLSKLSIFCAKCVDIGTELLTTKAIVTDMTPLHCLLPTASSWEEEWRHVGLEEKGCLQSKGKEQAGQRGDKGATGAGLLRKTWSELYTRSGKAGAGSEGSWTGAAGNQCWRVRGRVSMGKPGAAEKRQARS